MNFRRVRVYKFIMTFMCRGGAISLCKKPANTSNSNHYLFLADAIMFQYYIKIVPTLLEKDNGETVFTNQFSVTKYQKSVSPATGESGMPGVFFNYELSPLMVKYAERKK